jgi:capsular exopolysaccharide synthesis family protein
MSRSTLEHQIIGGGNPQTAELYRMLQAQLDTISRTSQAGVLMVTSAERGEGKTTVAANLAMTYARSGRRTALIDMNVRNAELHRLFNLQSRTGLSEALSGRKTALGAMQSTLVPNMDIMAASDASANAAHELASEQVPAMLRDIRSAYDIVLIDTPAVLHCADPLFISRGCDAALFVVHAGRTKKGAVHRALAQLAQVEATVIGTVLNRYNPKDRAGASFLTRN